MDLQDPTHAKATARKATGAGSDRQRCSLNESITYIYGRKIDSQCKYLLIIQEERRYAHTHKQMLTTRSKASVILGIICFRHEKSHHVNYSID